LPARDRVLIERHLYHEESCSWIFQSQKIRDGDLELIYDVIQAPTKIISHLTPHASHHTPYNVHLTSIRSLFLPSGVLVLVEPVHFMCGEPAHARYKFIDNYPLREQPGTLAKPGAIQLQLAPDKGPRLCTLLRRPDGRKSVDVGQHRTLPRRMELEEVHWMHLVCRTGRRISQVGQLNNLYGIIEIFRVHAEHFCRAPDVWMVSPHQQYEQIPERHSRRHVCCWDCVSQ